MEFEDGKKAIARIYSAAGEVAGVGFLVSECYLLTCAHVVEAAVGISTRSDRVEATVTLAFPLATDNQRYQAQVVFYELDATAYGNDMAVLRLETAPPVPIQPIRLEPLTSNARELKVFGFPKGDEAGRNLSAVPTGSVAGGWEQIEDTKQAGIAIEEGFSGAPVWSQAQKAFVGMVVARDKRRPEAKVGFMIPTDQLRSLRMFMPLPPSGQPMRPQWSRAQQLELERLRIALTDCERDHQGVAAQLRVEQDAPTRHKLELQLQAIVEEMDRIEQQLQGLGEENAE